ncbi:DUF2062 domain-containing protein [Ruficoccus amylovorans]|uniref:DUF2062 domain-containing protein n=1 Tax=Ruficoccus amylovorans TaxID=1804625 RepID=A0A842HJG7_9BACT|nr:DUF2062 domain-containing protein [Ruficoccus amylovorans]MBC2595774.1 DUF2062 domain-containing protein [Ruficoccus amylovorans]
MTTEERHEQLKRKLHERIRRVKRLMRPLPRRATVHRYPFLKWFAQTARKRSYLWSFRRQHVLPAIYVGCILSMMPIYGIQIPCAFAVALLIRGNLMIMVATQFITNPVTFVPLYTAACFIGLEIMYLFGMPIPGGSVWDFSANIALHLKEMVTDLMGASTPRASLAALVQSTGMSGHALVALALKATILGGAIMGYLIGFVISLVYQIMARYYERSGRAIRQQFEEFARQAKLKIHLPGKNADPKDSTGS